MDVAYLSADGPVKAVSKASRGSWNSCHLRCFLICASLYGVQIANFCVHVCVRACDVCVEVREQPPVSTQEYRPFALSWGVSH